jgi:hypothetical protein
MSLKIHPDGTVELTSEEDIRLYKLYQEISGNGRPVATPVVPTTANEPPETTAAAAPSHKDRPIRVHRGQDAILATIKGWEPHAPGRKEIAEHLKMDDQKVSEQLAELKRIGLIANGAPPNSWKWKLTHLAQTAGWTTARIPAGPSRG